MLAEHELLSQDLTCLAFVSVQEMDNQLLQLGDVSHHAPVLLAWALLRHTINPEESTNVIRRMGSNAIQLNVFQYLTKLLRSLSSGGKNVSSYSRICKLLKALNY